MFFNAEQTSGATGAVIPEKAPGGGSEQNRNLSPQQFGKKAGPAEAEGAEAGAGAAEGAAAAGGEAGAAGLAELAPLLLL